MKLSFIYIIFLTIYSFLSCLSFSFSYYLVCWALSGWGCSVIVIKYVFNKKERIIVKKYVFLYCIIEHSFFFRDQIGKVVAHTCERFHALEPQFNDLTALFFLAYIESSLLLFDCILLGLCTCRSIVSKEGLAVRWEGRRIYFNIKYMCGHERNGYLIYWNGLLFFS